MNTNENWIAEQARLLDQEDGFGPAYTPTALVPASDADPELPAA
jgi:hypothetical protein